MLYRLGTFLSRFKLYRRLTGGVWVKLKGRWHKVQVICKATDGTRFFRAETSYFHETYLGIQGLESYK